MRFLLLVCTCRNRSRPDAENGFDPKILMEGLASTRTVFIKCSLSSNKPHNSHSSQPQAEAFTYTTTRKYRQMETLYWNIEISVFAAWLQCTSAAWLWTMSVKMAREPAYRDIVGAGDCASILPVMCFCEMARKKTPNRRWGGKERRERDSSNTLLLPQCCDSEWIKKSPSFQTNKKTLFLVSFYVD